MLNIDVFLPFDRLCPITPNLARVLEKSFILQGYQVPAGVWMIFTRHVSYFEYINIVYVIVASNLPNLGGESSRGELHQRARIHSGAMALDGQEQSVFHHPFRRWQTDVSGKASCGIRNARPCRKSAYQKIKTIFHIFIFNQCFSFANQQLLKNFDIEFHRPMETIHNFIVSPKGPLKVTFRDRC